MPMICVDDRFEKTGAYTRRQIKNDEPGSHDFRRFLRQFCTYFLEILQRPFSIKILTGVKISRNNNQYFKS